MVSHCPWLPTSPQSVFQVWCGQGHPGSSFLSALSWSIFCLTLSSLHWAPTLPRGLCSGCPLSQEHLFLSLLALSEPLLVLFILENSLHLTWKPSPNYYFRSGLPAMCCHCTIHSLFTLLKWCFNHMYVIKWLIFLFTYWKLPVCSSFHQQCLKQCLYPTSIFFLTTIPF